MSFASRFNKSTGRFKLVTTGFTYRKLADCYKEFGADKVYTIGAVFINTKSAYGDSPVVSVYEGFHVNLPKHMLNDCREMMNDDNVVADINRGICGFTIYTYPSYGKTCYSVRWVDIPPDDVAEEEGKPESSIPF